MRKQFAQALQLKNKYPTATGLADVMVVPLWSTVTPSAGEDEWELFQKLPASAGENKSRTNIISVNEVPSKQFWDIHGMETKFVFATALTSVQLGLFHKFCFDSTLTIKVNDVHKISITLGDILGITTAFQPADAVSTTNTQSIFGKGFDFKGNDIVMDENTPYTVTIRNHTGGFPAELVGLDIRCIFNREFIKLLLKS